MTPGGGTSGKAATEPARRSRRRQSVAFRRDKVLAAAEALFRERGLERTSLRAIAAAAGYSPAALYRYFDNKEALYAALVEESLSRLETEMARGAEAASKSGKAERLLLAFFEHYRQHPRDLDLGLYLFNGTAKRGLGAAHDGRLNALLNRALAPLQLGLQESLGMEAKRARERLLEIAALSVGLLILENTGRLAILGGRARPLMLARAKEIVALETEVWR